MAFRVTNEGMISMQLLRGRYAAAAVVLAATSDCGSGQEETAAAAMLVGTVSGVVVVSHTGTPPSWRLLPIVSIGTLGTASGPAAPDEFGRIAGVVADPGGRVFVADAQGAGDPRLRKFMRTLGRPGSGPGEFEGLQGLAWLGRDTLVAMDPGNARLTLLSSEGEFLGQWPWVRLTGSARFLFNGGRGRFTPTPSVAQERTAASNLYGYVTRRRGRRILC